MLERVTSKKYRFSILRLIYNLDTLVSKIAIPKYPKVQWMVIRMTPVLIGEAMVVVTNLNKVIYPILGVVLAESILIFRARVTGLLND